MVLVKLGLSWKLSTIIPCLLTDKLLSHISRVSEPIALYIFPFASKQLRIYTSEELKGENTSRRTTKNKRKYNGNFKLPPLIFETAEIAPHSS